MTNLPAETPWWAASIIAVLALLIPVIKTNRKVNRQDKEIEKVHHQVANEHSTNLRDDVDGVWADSRQARDNSQQLKEMLGPIILTVQQMAESQKNSAITIDMMANEQKMQRKDIGGIREEVREVRRDVSAVGKDLNEHLIEVAERKTNE